MKYQIKIDPQDKLFFKDARPMNGSSIGSGANWPLPTGFHSALLSAIHENGYDEIWESEHKHLTPKEQQKKHTRFNLGGLKTLGPFPTVANELYFPVPADLEVSEKVMQPIVLNSCSNLPKPLKYGVANLGSPTKNEIGQWISATELRRYLSGIVGDKIMTKASSELFINESAPGVAIDPETRSNIDGKFYQAEYLRLKGDVSMTAFAECFARKFSGESIDVLANFFNTGRQHFIFGGERKVTSLEGLRKNKNYFNVQPTQTRYVKWVLLSPALFNHGWLPDWIDPENGRVQLNERPEKGNLSRKEWRAKIKTAAKIGAELVAAKVTKPLAMSGWKLDPKCDNAGGKPKATRLAVQSGSVYYFECDDEHEAEKLVKELHGQVKSTQFGEQGFGLGVCGQWTLKNI